MVEDNLKLHKKNEPVLLDKVVQDLQESLENGLPWLNIAFGRGYKLVEHQSNGGKFIYPAAYIGDSDYISLLPSDKYGNFCWFDIYDPQEIVTLTQALPQFTFSGAIIFWFNLNTIFADSDAIYLEEIKDEIIKLLTSPGIIKTTGRLKINKLYERFENIYKGYSLEKIYNSNIYKGDDIQSIDKQFFMHPYCGLRVEFELTTRELCQRYIK